MAPFRAVGVQGTRTALAPTSRRQNFNSEKFAELPTNIGTGFHTGGEGLGPLVQVAFAPKKVKGEGDGENQRDEKGSRVRFGLNDGVGRAAVLADDGIADHGIAA